MYFDHGAKVKALQNAEISLKIHDFYWNFIEIKGKRKNTFCMRLRVNSQMLVDANIGQAGSSFEIRH